MTLQTTIHGVDVLVDYTFYNGWRGARDRFGVPMEPDEPPNIEIDRVQTLASYEDITELLSQRVEDELIEKVWDHIKEAKDDYWD